MASKTDIRNDHPDKIRIYLTMMLADQIQSLGILHRNGYWEDSPWEIDPALEVDESATIRERTMQQLAIDERDLWKSNASDNLYHAVHYEIGYHVNRDKVTTRAKYVSEHPHTKLTCIRTTHRPKK